MFYVALDESFVKMETPRANSEVLHGTSMTWFFLVRIFHGSFFLTPLSQLSLYRY